MRSKKTVNNKPAVERSMRRDLPGLANTSGFLPFFSL